MRFWRETAPRKAATTAVLLRNAESSALVPIRRAVAVRSLPFSKRCDSHSSIGVRSSASETSNSSSRVASAGLVYCCSRVAVSTNPNSR